MNYLGQESACGFFLVFFVAFTMVPSSFRYGLDLTTSLDQGRFSSRESQSMAYRPDHTKEEVSR